LLTVGKTNTTITGQVVDENYKPVSGARVYLKNDKGNIVLDDTTTNAEGNYTFSKVENGIKSRIEAFSLDETFAGYINSAGDSTLSLTCNKTSEALITQVKAEQIILKAVDNINPFVITISPENNVDTSTTVSIIYTFSETIKQTAYTRTDLPKGHNTIVDDITFTFEGLKKATASPINFTVRWNAKMDELTIKPTELIGSARYKIVISLTKLTDKAGNAVVNNPKIIGDFEAFNFTTAGKSTLPGAVTLSLQRTVPEPLDYSGGKILLAWNADANARTYKVYRQQGSDSPFEFISEVGGNIFEDLDNLPLVYPGTSKNPLKAISLSYKVRGVSKDLVEGNESNTVSVSDLKKPVPDTSAVAVDVDSSSSTSVDYVVVSFSEPMDKSVAETANNYFFVNVTGSGTTGSVSKATYLGFDAVLNKWRVRLELPKRFIHATDQFTIQSVKDLAGNSTTAITFRFPK
jgi:hypothetical protein